MIRKRLIGLATAFVAIAGSTVLVTQVIVPGSTEFANSQNVSAAPDDSLGLNTAGSSFTVMNIRPVVQSNPTATSTAALYTSCTVQRGSTPTPTGSVATAAATEAATAVATSAASVAATAAATASAADYTVFDIAGAESEACYQVGESLPGKGEPFNLAVGVTTAIAGQIAVDMNNLSASKIGQMVIDISQFKSDQSMRDGFIRRNFLESNTYPLAKFTPTQIIGLPSRAYVSGEVLTFQIVGTLNVHNTDHTETLNVSAHLVDANTLVSIATTDILMTDFNVTPPTIANFVTANNQTHLILNLVAHPTKKSS